MEKSSVFSMHQESWLGLSWADEFVWVRHSDATSRAHKLVPKFPWESGTFTPSTEEKKWWKVLEYDLGPSGIISWTAS